MAIKSEEESLLVLLKYPYFWSPEKIINFLVKILSELKHLTESDPTALTSLNNKAQELGVLEYQNSAGNWDWGKGFSEAQLAVLTGFYNNKKEHVPRRDFSYKRESVTDWVKVFRDKNVHLRDLPDEAKQTLFGVIPAKSALDNAYVSFWISRFPRLLVFLWLQFKQHANDSWSQYYPANMCMDTENAPRDVQTFLENFNQILKKMKSFGCMKSRYTANNKILEFYQISEEILTVGLLGTRLQIHQDGIIYYWRKEDCLEYGTNIEGRLNCSELTDCSVVFSDKITPSDLQYNINHCPNKRIVFLVTKVANISMIVRQVVAQCAFPVKEIPLTLNECDNETIERVQSIPVNFGEIQNLTRLDCLVHRQEMNHILKGSILNELLSVKELHIFQDLESRDDYFLNRHVVLRLARVANVDIPPLEQEEFLQNVLIDQSPHQVICLSGKCGSGKTTFIKYLAKELSSEGSCKLTVVFSMRKFLEMILKVLPGEIAPLNDIVTIIINHVSKTDFEKQLVKFWIENSLIPGIRLEIFFDGLDEISEEYEELTYKILEALRENCLSIRLWVISRDYLAPEIVSRFRPPRFELVPLSYEESVKIIEQTCRRIYKNKCKVDPHPHTVLFYTALASVCIHRLHKENSDLASVPGHCIMMADFVMNAVFEYERGNNNVNARSLVQLNSSRVLIYVYQYLLERKLDVFMEKFDLSLTNCNSMKHHNRNLYGDYMTRSATVLAIQFLFGKEAGKYLEKMIIQNEIHEHIVLNQGIVQKLFPESVFCHNSLADFIVAEFVYKVFYHGNYLGIKKQDTYFQKLFREVLIAKRYKSLGNERHEFAYPHLVAMFIWLCVQTNAVDPEKCKEIAWFRKYYDWTKESNYCFNVFRKSCVECPHNLIMQNDLAMLLDPNVFMVFEYHHPPFRIRKQS